jgi:hypothetical protein
MTKQAQREAFEKFLNGRQPLTDLAQEAWESAYSAGEAAMRERALTLQKHAAVLAANWMGSPLSLSAAIELLPIDEE